MFYGGGIHFDCVPSSLTGMKMFGDHQLTQVNEGTGCRVDCVHLCTCVYVCLMMMLTVIMMVMVMLAVNVAVGTVVKLEKRPTKWVRKTADYQIRPEFR